jgi:hypothetical protein
MINKPLIAALICALPFASNSAKAADVKILCASGMREIVSELQPRLGQVGGQQISISFGEAGDLRKRIQGGEIVDVAILPRIVLDQVAADGNVVAGTLIDISQSSIGIGVRKDGPKPDISSAEKFKQVLLAAKAIVVGDPASGGVAAVHVADVLRRLGIMDQLTPSLSSHAVNGTQRSWRKAKLTLRFSSRMKSGWCPASNSFRFRRSSDGHSFSRQPLGQMPRTQTLQGRSYNFSRDLKRRLS